MGPSDQKAADPLPQTESDSFELIFFFPRITCMILLLLFSLVGLPLGSFQGSIKPWLWNIWNRPLELIDTLRFENPAWASGWESEGEVWISEFSNWRYKKLCWSAIVWNTSRALLRGSVSYFNSDDIICKKKKQKAVHAIYSTHQKRLSCHVAKLGYCCARPSHC